MSADHLKPREAAEVEQAIQWALAGGKTLEVVGRGSKRAIGRAAQWDATLDLSGLSGVTLYEPEELVLSAQGRHAACRDRSAGRRQRAGARLRADGLWPRPRCRAPAPAPSAARSRRISPGRGASRRAPRATIFSASRPFPGRGETFKSGGRVVKNVTGYDLCKLLAGSWGTLAAMTDVTVKTLPRAETEETVLVLGLDDAAAGKRWRPPWARLPMSRRRRICRRPRRAHRRDCVGRRAASRRFRLEGVAPSVAHRKGVLEKLLTPFGALGDAWRSGVARVVARDPRRRAVCRERVRAAQRDLWRISTAPTRGADVGRVLTEQAGAEAPLRLGRRSRLGRVAARGRCRSAAGARRGRVRPAATRRSFARRRRCAPRSTSSARGARALAALTKRVRESFDPQGVLNPGRMWAGVYEHDADLLHAGAACRSRHRGIGKDPARLRALRLLHRDLPDLCARRQRARFAARAHLPDQGHAGERPAGDRRSRHAYRSLPVLPRLHDDLPVGRALHAPGRPCPRPYRAHLSPAAGRSPAARGCWPG